MSAVARLPATIHVIERGWLSSNNVLLFDGPQAAVIDSGYRSHAEQTVSLLRDVVDGRRLTRLINTHSHSDHIGGNAAVQRAFGCSITIPAGMHDAVATWDEEALLLSTAAQSGERFRADHLLEPGDRLELGELTWEALAAPGHDMDALVFYSPDCRVLISGDALWRNGFGILFADVLGTGDGIGAARETLEGIARLPIDVVIPGHGAAFVEVDDALAKAFGRLRSFEEDGARMARNAIRACVTFSLLEKRSIALDELPQQLHRVPLYRIANERFLGLSPEALANWLVGELERAGVARREGELLLAV